MPKRTSTAKRLDTVQNAHRVVLESVQQTETIVSLDLVARVMADMGRKGGRIGGKRRLETLSPERRQEIARHAATARWAKVKRTRRRKRPA